MLPAKGEKSLEETLHPSVSARVRLNASPTWRMASALGGIGVDHAREFREAHASRHGDTHFADEIARAAGDDRGAEESDRYRVGCES